MLGLRPALDGGVHERHKAGIADGSAAFPCRPGQGVRQKVAHVRREHLQIQKPLFPRQFPAGLDVNEHRIEELLFGDRHRPSDQVNLRLEDPRKFGPPVGIGPQISMLASERQEVLRPSRSCFFAGRHGSEDEAAHDAGALHQRKPVLRDPRD